MKPKTTYFLFLFAVLALLSCREQKMASASMEPAIKSGEMLEADYTAYVNTEPQRWDVVVFESTAQPDKVWCHRVVGLPGETIDIVNGTIVINGVEQPYPAKMSGVKYSGGIAGETKIVFPYKIPDKNYFLLGDNTDDAADSRYHGPIPKDNIVAKVTDK